MSSNVYSSRYRYTWKGRYGMTIPQLEKLAKPYGCHVKRQGPLVAIQNASYSAIEYIDYLPSKRPQDIVPILEKLSGKKIRELWTGGKGGGA